MREPDPPHGEAAGHSADIVPSVENRLPFDTVDAWSEWFVSETDFFAKLVAPPLPDTFAAVPRAPLDLRPGRGNGFVLSHHSDRSTGKSALKSPERRAKLVHAFMHHELQAAELMAWALLRFPDAPAELRRGLVRIIGDELRHLRMYASYLRSRGFEPGCFPVRDWFWERIPDVVSMGSFLGTLGIGFEGANLDHAMRFAQRFAQAGDEDAARLQERVAIEEVPHVRFAVHWFRKLEHESMEATSCLFDAWRDLLPPPLSPLVMRGRPLARTLRVRAGLDESFLDSLDAFAPEA
jgi:uncharacterized ferritin-like protein (DUF455 family)